MKKNFVLAFVFLTMEVFAQRPSEIIPVTSSSDLLNDTTFKVVYANEKNQSKIPPPAYFLNGQFVKQTLILNSESIDSIHVTGKNIQIEAIQYHGEIYIKTKSNYALRLKTLTDLKRKYTSLESKPTLFMIDGEFVSNDVDRYLIDENQLLRIIVEHVKSEKENIDLIIIKLLTKSAENIKKVNTFPIRGTD